MRLKLKLQQYRNDLHRPFIRMFSQSPRLLLLLLLNLLFNHIESMWPIVILLYKPHWPLLRISFVATNDSSLRTIPLGLTNFHVQVHSVSMRHLMTTTATTTTIWDTLIRQPFMVDQKPPSIFAQKSAPVSQTRNETVYFTVSLTIQFQRFLLHCFGGFSMGSSSDKLPQFAEPSSILNAQSVTSSLQFHQIYSTRINIRISNKRVMLNVSENNRPPPYVPHPHFRTGRRIRTTNWIIIKNIFPSRFPQLLGKTIGIEFLGAIRCPVSCW